MASKATDTCAVVAKMASGIMERRQNGFPMQALVEAAEEKGGPLSKLMISLTQEAYAEPRFSTAEFRQRKTEDFTNRKYAQCYENLTQK